MYLESPLEHSPGTAYIVLDWLWQIALEASELFIKIFQEIWLFLVAQKRKGEFFKRKNELAQLLGSMYKAMLECQTSNMMAAYPVCAR